MFVQTYLHFACIISGVIWVECESAILFSCIVKQLLIA